MVNADELVEALRLDKDGRSKRTAAGKGELEAAEEDIERQGRFTATVELFVRYFGCFR